MPRAIVIFARAPEVEAAVKGLPARFAALFQRTVAAWLQEPGAVPIISCAADARGRFDAILPEINRLYIEQRGSTFGERLASTAEAAFALGFDEVVITGIDAPPAAGVFAALAHARAVVVPALDGGINLIALRAPERELLASIEPRQRDVLARCRAYFGDGLVVLEESSDIDSLAVRRWPLAEVTLRGARTPVRRRASRAPPWRDVFRHRTLREGKCRVITCPRISLGLARSRKPIRNCSTFFCSGTRPRWRRERSTRRRRS